MNNIDALPVLAQCFALAATGGLANVLRSKETMSLKYAVGTILYAGLSGLCVTSFWQEGPVIAMACATGLLGPTAFELLMNRVIKTKLGMEVSRNDRHDS